MASSALWPAQILSKQFFSFAGLPGFDGPDGLPGITGEKGYAGIPGLSGPPGEKVNITNLSGEKLQIKGCSHYFQFYSKYLQKLF